MAHKARNGTAWSFTEKVADLCFKDIYSCRNTKCGDMKVKGHQNPSYCVWTLEGPFWSGDAGWAQGTECTAGPLGLKLKLLPFTSSPDPSTSSLVFVTVRGFE